jgi:hypothetical protein
MVTSEPAESQASTVRARTALTAPNVPAKP